MSKMTAEEKEEAKRLAKEKAAKFRAGTELRKERAVEISKRLQGKARPIIVEVGVEIGRFSLAILEAVPSGMLYMVDNWLPYKSQPAEYLDTKDPSAFRDAAQQEQRYQQACLVVSKFPKRARILKMDSTVAANSFENGCIDLVFIDGDHSYRGVKRDIAAWWPKVKPGGWIGGHDYKNPSTKFDFSGVDRAVEEEFANVEVGFDYTWWRKK